MEDNEQQIQFALFGKCFNTTYFVSKRRNYYFSSDVSHKHF